MRFLFALILLCVLMYSCDSKKESIQEADSSEKQSIPPSLKQESLEPVFLEDLEEERTDWQNPETVLQAFNNLESKTVADIGAGAGYFSFKLARQAEKVIALDIDPKALEYINEQKEIVGNWADNIEPRLTPPDVPNLLPNEADAVLVVNTFSFIPKQESYFKRLKGGMKVNAELVIVDFKKGEIPVGPADDRKMEASEVRAILRKAGFRSISIDDKSLQYQYIIKALN